MIQQYQYFPTDDEVINLIKSVPIHYVTNRFEVGSVGVSLNWSSDITTWAASSNGVVGQTHPIISTIVTFDSHSGDCSVDVSSACASLTLTGYAGTLTLSNSLSITGTLTLTNGTINTAGNNLSCLSFSSNNSNTRSLTIDSTSLTLKGTGTIWDTSTVTGLAFSGTSSTVLIIDTSSTAKTFNGGGLTFGNVTLSGSSGNVTFAGTNTWGTFTSGASNLIFSNNQIATSFVLTGCLSLTGNLQQSSGTVTAPAGCTITNSTASGGATFNGTIDGGGNSGWNFSSPGKLLRVSAMDGLGLFFSSPI